MAPNVRRIGSFAMAVAVALAACDPTPTSTPTTTALAVVPTTRPSIAPVRTPEALPTPETEVSGIVPVRVQVIGGPLDGRFGSSGIWTGSDVLIWGGVFLDDFFNGPWKHRRTGAAYDPAADDWSQMARAPISGRWNHLAAWTGREMLVWGGYAEDWSAGNQPDGAAYNPRRDRWRSMAPSPLPWAQGPAAVMAGDEWIVAATRNSGLVLVAAYNPKLDSWRSLPSIPHLQSRENRLVWTGQDVILANSADGMYVLSEGADTWLRSGSRPVGNEIVWTGQELIALPGAWQSALQLERYDPEADEWEPIAGPYFENGRPIWTGTHVLVIVDHGDPSFLYNPRTDVWLQLQLPRRFNVQDDVSIWTPNGLVEWGGWHGGVGAVSYEGGWVLRPDISRAELFEDPNTE